MNEDCCDVHLINEPRVRQAQEHVMDGLTATRVAEIFAALGDPTRVRLVSALAGGELCVCDLAATLACTSLPSRTSCGCCALCTWLGLVEMAVSCTTASPMTTWPSY